MRRRRGFLSPTRKNVPTHKLWTAPSIWPHRVQDGVVTTLTNNTCCDGSPNWSAGGKELLSVSDRGVCTGLGADHPSGGGAPAWVWIGEELLAVQTSDSRCVMLWRGRMVRYVLYSPARDRDIPGQVALREESPRLDVGAARPARSPISDNAYYGNRSLSSRNPVAVGVRRGYARHSQPP